MSDNKPIVKTSSQQPQNLIADVEFVEVKQFDGLIHSKGLECYIDRGLVCPCSDPNTGLALIGCENCGGSGWFFIDREETKALFLGMNSNKKTENWSETNMGKASITTPHSFNLTFMDRFIITELESTYSQKLKPIYSNGKIFSYTIYSPKQVLYCFLFNKNNQPLLRLEQGTDYNIINNRIEFDSKYIERVETDDFIVSLRYTHNPVYHIVDILREFTKANSQSFSCSEKSEVVEKKYLPLHFMGIKAHYIFDSENLFSNRLFDNTSSYQQG
jgi:hypothetical protein